LDQIEIGTYTETDTTSMSEETLTGDEKTDSANKSPKRMAFFSPNYKKKEVGNKVVASYSVDFDFLASTNPAVRKGIFGQELDLQSFPSQNNVLSDSVSDTNLDYSSVAGIFRDNILAEYKETYRQTNAGLYWIKRTSKLLHKVSELEAMFAKELTKIIEHEIGKFDGSSSPSAKYELDEDEKKDKMPHSWEVTQKVHSCLKDIANQHQQHSKTLLNCAKPMLKFFNLHQESITKDLGKVENGIKGIFDSKEKVMKQKAKLFSSYESCQKKNAKSRSPGKVSNSPTLKNMKVVNSLPNDNNSSTAAVIDEKTQNLSEDYIAAVDEVNRIQSDFFNRDVSELQDHFEFVEKSRIELIQAQIGIFTDSYRNFSGKISENMRELEKNVGTLNPQAELLAYCQTVDRSGQLLFQKVEYELPWSKEKHKGKSSSKTDGILSYSLQNLMSIEKATNPDAKVPQLFTALLDGIRYHNGFKTEGLFRISPGVTDLDALRNDINAGIYNIDVLDAHVPAAMLKEWLRELPDPLIPRELYEGCINIARCETQNIESYIEIIAKTDEANRNVIIELIEFIKEMAKPEHEEHTKMGLKNLAIVFAPSFLRSKSDDLAVLLKNNVFELQFVSNLIHLYDSEKFRHLRCSAVHTNGNLTDTSKDTNL
jgi:hypothetical protein